MPFDSDEVRDRVIFDVQRASEIEECDCDIHEWLPPAECIGPRFLEGLAILADIVDELIPPTGIHNRTMREGIQHVRRIAATFE